MSAKSWTLAILGIMASPVTGGGSLLLCAPLAKEAWDKSDNEKEAAKNANKQANAALNAQTSQKIQEEINELRKEREKQEAKNKKTEDQLHDFKQKLANRRPRADHETDDYLKKQIVILQAQLDKDKGESKNLTKKIDDLIKTMPKGNSSDWTLPDLLEMKTSTKIIVAGSVILLVYWFTIREDKKKS